MTDGVHWLHDVPYVIGIDGDRPVKVGIAVNVPDRLRHLQTGNPRRLHVLAQFPGYRALEELVHGHFASRRMIGEWFDFGDLDPVAEVSTFVQRDFKSIFPAPGC